MVRLVGKRGKDKQEKELGKNRGTCDARPNEESAENGGKGIGAGMEGKEEVKRSALLPSPLSEMTISEQTKRRLRVCYFSILPSELVIRDIFTFFSARELGKLEIVSRNFKFWARQDFLWAKHIKLDFATFRASRMEITKEHYVSRFIQFSAVFTTRARLKETLSFIRSIEIRRRQMFKMQRRFHKITRIMLGLMPFLSVLLIPKVLNGSISRIGSWSCLIPLDILAVILTESVVNAWVLYTSRDDFLSTRFGLWQQTNSLEFQLCTYFFGSESKALISAIVIFVLGLVFLVLLNLKLSMIPEMMWTVVFIPIWGIFIIGFCARMLNWACFSNFRIYLSFLFLFSIPFMTVSLLLPLKLDGVISTRLEVILVPIWVHTGIVFSWLLSDVLRPCIISNESYSESGWPAFTLAVLIYVPHITFLALLCSKLNYMDGDGGGLNVSWTGVFVPLYFFFVIFTCAMIILSVEYDGATYRPMDPARIPAERRRSTRGRGTSNRTTRHVSQGPDNDDTRVSAYDSVVNRLYPRTSNVELALV